jgi:Uncharacterized membrane protein
MALPPLYFEIPILLVFIIPAILLGFYFFKKSVGKKQQILISTRTVICVLLILALANPVSFLTITRTDTNPDMVLVSDTTKSMDLFSKGAGQDLYEFFSSRFNVQFDTIAGNYTALGEKVIQHADGRNQILLISDGNSNYGTDLKDAIDIAIETGTKVSGVVPRLEKNDLSVEMTGDKSVIVRNDQEFGVTVRQAGNDPVSFSYEVSNGGTVILRKSFTMEGPEHTSTFTTNFSTLGAQSLTVTITSSADTDPINNKYVKSVYVIEKPNVLVVTSESKASLSQVVGTLYNVTVVSGFSEFGSIENLNKALNASKVVVIDNMYIGNMTEAQVSALKTYVSEGGGLVVVGGPNSYGSPADNSYLNSSFEKLLPVISIPADWEGTQDVYLFVDVSDSANSGADNRETILSNIKKTAVNIIENDFFKDANMTILTIGDPDREDSGTFYFAGDPKDSQAMVREIENLKTGDGQTDIINTYDRAAALMENRTGQPLIIIMSDGNLLNRRTYNELLRATNSVDKYGATILFMNIYTNGSKRPEQFQDSRGRPYAQLLMRDYKGNNGVYVESNKGLPILPDFDQMFGGKENQNENVSKSHLYISNPKHFIVQGLNLTETNISGYNSVTPKAGSDKLVISRDGDPILTVWRYGLGRVASLTTDNGIGRGSYWAPDLYRAPGSKLVTATTNWVMGDPNKESGIVIDCPDTYVGLPVTLRVHMYDPGVPVLTLDGQKLLLTMESKDVYVTELVFDKSGTYNVSGYPITVNYPVEYRDIGINPDFEKLITSTGGRVYTVQEAKALYIQFNGDTATYKTKEAVNFNVFLLLAALLIFLAEVIYRRMREIKELKRLHEEYDRREKESPGSMPPRPDMSSFRAKNDMVGDVKKDASDFLKKIREKTNQKK